MPVFHTKTIESILEPVAQQVSRLVVLHEEAEDGAAMPDLTEPVRMVSIAVDNLVKVGYETIHSSDDQILRQDMPPALKRVEVSSRLLEDACQMLKSDPYSVPARKKLIDGARGILQGTSALLLCFDESEVRKIIRGCKKVLTYLEVVEVINTMEELIVFVKDISPWLTRVTSDVDVREKELTHRAHAEILVRCLASIKTLSPILICSMKIYIQITTGGGKGQAEAADNRNYLAGRMIDEINEIIRVLQLTTYDEDEWDADSISVMKKSLNAIESLLQAALDWLADPRAVRGGVGERSIGRIMEYSRRIADRALPDDANAIRRACEDIESMTASLAELRDKKQGDTPQAQGLAASIAQKLKDLIGTREKLGLLQIAIQNLERSSYQQPAHTVWGRIEQALGWLSNPGVDDHGLGLQAIRLVTAEGRKIADFGSPADRARLISLCDDIDRLANQLADLVKRGQGNSPEAHAVAEQLRSKLMDLRDLMLKLLIERVVEDFADISTPLKMFVDSAMTPEGTPGREQNFNDKARHLEEHSGRQAATGHLVAMIAAKDKRLVEAINTAANTVSAMTPQVINAGKIRFHHADPRADEHFTNLHSEYSNALARLRALVDEAIDSVQFITATEAALHRRTDQCERSVSTHEPQLMIDATSHAARYANRVVMVGRQEADNSEDARFVAGLNQALGQLQGAITPMVQNAKQVALNTNDPGAAASWRDSNRRMIDGVAAVKRALMPAGSAAPDMNILSINGDNVSAFPEDDEPPPRPPPPVEDDDLPPPALSSHSGDSGRGRTPELEEEAYQVFWERVPLNDPSDSAQPILGAAHSLHQAIKQWESRENAIVGAAKRMALLMARLSQLVRGVGGSKKDLIDVAKAIAEASEEVTRLAVQLARQCTDKRMRNSLLQVCEKIPTIGTQLKILSTVKATLLGSQGTDEDQEAMELLVLNAQNLMQSVKDTVNAAESATIKIKTDSGLRLRWVRKPLHGF